MLEHRKINQIDERHHGGRKSSPGQSDCEWTCGDSSIEIKQLSSNKRFLRVFA